MSDSSSGYRPIEELDFFADLEHIVDGIWERVQGWTSFAQDSVGLQLVKAADSIGANLVEGDGRYSDKESLHFFSIARASARETHYWLRRSASRGLLPKEIVETYLQELISIMRRLNALITTRRNRLNQVREQRRGYTSSQTDEWDDTFPFDPFTQQPNDPTT